MKLIEFQGKELFRRAGIPVPEGELAKTPEEVRAFIERRPGAWVLKSQVLMGGRGKAGGIKFAKTPEEGERTARALLGTTLRGPQNPQGELVRALLVEEKLAIASEAYLSIAIDRARKRAVALASAKGGMDVEEVAASDPGAIVSYAIDPAVGVQPFVARRLAFEGKLPAGYRKAFPQILVALYRMFLEYGANLVEINPLVLATDGRVVASDAKVELDDSGLFKHPELAGWREQNPLDADEAAALEAGLGLSNYAKLEGEIGLIANGAGLGMGTMDAIRSAGGKPANFLDIGGGASAERVEKSYRLVVSDPRVRAVFVNIFGGITRGDQVARGIVEALGGRDIRRVPLVVRLTGTNEREGRAILAEAGFEPVETMDEGARRAVELAHAAPLFNKTPSGGPGGNGGHAAPLLK
ncbi:MAG: ADP-forming succinate--CoA ligase subunit beta [Vulcanimicrobiaceae bacterium]